MNAPLRLRKVSPGQVACRNAVSAHGGPFFLDWLGGRWEIALSSLPPCPPRPDRFSIEAGWGGARVFLRLDPAWIDQVGQAMLGSDALDALPERLRLAVLEAAFAQAAGRIEAASGRRLRLVAVGGERTDCQEMEGFGLECRAVGHAASGELWMDEAGLAQLAGALRPLAGMRGPASPHRWDGLPLTLRFSVGWVDLPTRVLADTAARDVIMLDECWLQGKDGITVQVGRTTGFRATLRDTVATVTEGLGEIMADTLESAVLDEPGELDDVTVRLTFDLGERSVTLGELKSLAPGFTFDLGRDLRRVVTIRANGMPIGEGELVDIEGRVGVAVLTLHRFAE